MSLRQVISTLSTFAFLVPIAYGNGTIAKGSTAIRDDAHTATIERQNTQSKQKKKCPEDKPYSVDFEKSGDIYDVVVKISGKDNTRTRKIKVNKNGVAANPLVLQAGESAMYNGKIRDLEGNRLEGYLTFSVPKNLEGILNQNNIFTSEEIIAALKATGGKFRIGVIGFDKSNCQRASYWQDVVVCPEGEDYKEIIKLLEEHWEKYEGTLRKLKGDIDALKDLIKKEKKTTPIVIQTPPKVPIKPKPKNLIEIATMYGKNNTVSLDLLANLYRSKNFGVLFGLSGSYGLDKQLLGPKRAQDHSWDSTKFSQWLHSTTDLSGEYSPMELAALLQLEFGKQDGLRLGIEGKAGIALRNMDLKLQKTIEGMDYGNILENRKLDLGNEKYNDFFFAALGYLKIPVTKNIDLYFKTGAVKTPGIFVDKINGQALITNVGPKNGIQLYDGKIEHTYRIGLNFKIF